MPELVCFVLLIGLQVDGDLAFLEQPGLKVLQGTGASSPVIKAPGAPVREKGFITTQISTWAAWIVLFHLQLREI